MALLHYHPIYALIELWYHLCGFGFIHGPKSGCEYAKPKTDGKLAEKLKAVMLSRLGD